MTEHLGENIQYVLPKYDEAMGGWSCARDFVRDKPCFRCGCPNCLRKDGLTLVFSAEDWNPEVNPNLAATWRKRLVSLKTGRMAAHLILPHYPGFDPTSFPSDDPG